MGVRSLLPLLAISAVYVVATAPLMVQPGVGFDERLFLDVGQAIASTGAPIQTFGRARPSFFFDHTPLLVYATAAATFLGGDTLSIMRAFVWLTGLATMVTVYAIVRGWQGFLAAALLATSFLFTNMAWVLHMEVPMAFAMAATVWFLQRAQFGQAGLAVATAVMFKEFALLFLAVMAVAVVVRRGWWLAFRFVAPSVIAFAGWLTYAWWLSPVQFGLVLQRWLGSATSNTEGRFPGSSAEWLVILIGQLGPILLAFAVVGCVYTGFRRRPTDIWALASVVYVIAAIGASAILAEKTARWVLGAIPLAAIAGGLMLRPLDLRDAKERWHEMRRVGVTGTRADRGRARRRAGFDGEGV